MKKSVVHVSEAWEQFKREKLDPIQNMGVVPEEQPKDQPVDDWAEAQKRRRQNLSLQLLGYDITAIPLKETQAVKFFRALPENNKPVFFLILGGTGAGKTFSVVHYVCNESLSNKNKSVKLIHAYKMAQLIYRKDFKELDEFEKVGTLIIDDLGAEPDGFRGADFIAHLDYLIDHRWKFQKPTFITSNMQAKQIAERYGERFVSRVKSSVKVFETTDCDFRVQKGENQ